MTKCDNQQQQGEYRAICLWKVGRQSFVISGSDNSNAIFCLEYSVLCIKWIKSFFLDQNKDLDFWLLSNDMNTFKTGTAWPAVYNDCYQLLPTLIARVSRDQTDSTASAAVQPAIS